MSKLSINRVPDFIHAAHRADLPFILIGRHGSGKSEVVENTAKKLGIGFEVLDLTLLEPVDLIGLPKIIADKTSYIPPSILPRSGKGLLLLEELNRASEVIRACVLELLTRRRIHEYSLPENWLPCATINPSGKSYMVDALDPALLSRFITVNIKIDKKAWLKWAAENGIDQRIIEFVTASPDAFETKKYSDENSSETDNGINPRSLEYCSRFIKACQELKIDREILSCGLMGV